jgi:protein-tyrosine phosphatase
MIIDFHSHILPKIDDGSSAVEESIAMLRKEAEQGITQVIATPHFYPRHDSPERFLARRRSAEAMLQEAMVGQNDLPQVICGAEVYFFSGISECEALPELTIGGKNCILIEMPPVPWTKNMYSELEAIPARWGLAPIIAHVDRYLGVLSTHGIPQQLERLPVLVQANASFFLRSGTRNRALQLLRRDQIQLLGSDCHNLTDRPPNLDKAVQIISKHLPSDILKRVEDYQKQVLSDA